MKSVVSLVLSGAALFGLAACAQTSRLVEDISHADLVRDNKAIVLMKIGSVDPACTRANLLLGWRDGPGFKAARLVAVQGINDMSRTAVSELEVIPGEYHVIGYWCGTDENKQFGFSSRAGKGQAVYRSSLASFSVARGEVVNVGYVRFDAGRVRRNLLSHSVTMTLTVSDWPLAELQRYESQRPALYAAMRTRLMTVSPAHVSPEEQRRMCDDLARRRLDGKIEAMPASCLTPVARL